MTELRSELVAIGTGLRKLIDSDYAAKQKYDEEWHDKQHVILSLRNKFRVCCAMTEAVGTITDEELRALLLICYGFKKGWIAARKTGHRRTCNDAEIWKTQHVLPDYLLWVHTRTHLDLSLIPDDFKVFFRDVTLG